MNTEINFDLFEDVPSPQDYRSAFRLSLYKSGKLSQNEAFKNELGGRQEFRLRVSPDGRLLILDPKEPHNMTFTPNGVRTHRNLLDTLRSKGLLAPLTYQVSWLEEQGFWLCRYDGLCPPPRKAVRADKRKAGAV